MLILLPPSEAKTPGGTGPAVGPLPALSTPGLAGERAALVHALTAAVSSTPKELAVGLKLPPARVEAALEANRRVSRAPTRPALDRYAGVLFASLDAPSLPPSARERAARSVVVVSGLWGVVRGDDLIPDYRVPASGTVPGIGNLTSYWREPLAVTMPALLGDEPVLDLRSTDYRALWRPRGACRDQVVAVRVLSRRPDGRVGAVSHHAKTVKGLVVRHLVTSRRSQRDAMVALQSAAGALGATVVDTSTRTSRSADLVVPFA